MLRLAPAVKVALISLLRKFSWTIVRMTSSNSRRRTPSTRWCYSIKKNLLKTRKLAINATMMKSSCLKPIATWPRRRPRATEGSPLANFYRKHSRRSRSSSKCQLTMYRSRGLLELLQLLHLLLVMRMSIMGE